MKKSVLAVPNWKRQEIPKSNERGFNDVTRPAVWVQITIKKQRVNCKNLLHLKYPTIIAIFSLCTYEDFLSKMVLSYPSKLIILKQKNLEKYGSWFVWLLMGKMSRELIVGSQVPFNLQQFYLTKENLKIFYNLEGIPMKALEARSDTEWFG